MTVIVLPKRPILLVAALLLALLGAVVVTALIATPLPAPSGATGTPQYGTTR